MTGPEKDDIPNDYTIAAVDRAMALLEILGRIGPASLADLAKEAGSTRTVSFRILRTLTARGFAIQDGPRGTWRLGARLTALGESAATQGALALLAAARLAQLARDSGEVVYLLGRAGLEAEVLAIHQVDPKLYRYSPVGGRRPLHAGAGRMLLAMAPEMVQVQILSVPLSRYTPVTITDPRRVAADLARIRERGGLITDNEAEAGAVSINAPILDEAGQCGALVTIVGPAMRLRGNRARDLLPLVMEAAADISRSLGWVDRRAKSGGGRPPSAPTPTTGRRRTDLKN